MAAFMNSISVVTLLFLLMGVGYFLGKIGWIDGRVKKFLSLFVVNVCVPANCLTGILNNMTHEDLLASWKYVLVAAASILINLVIAITAAHFLRLPRSRGGVFIAQSFLANTIFIGVPVCTQLFGDVSIPYLMMYYLASTTFNQSLAMLLVSHAGTGGAKKITPAGLLHDIVTKPPIIGIIVSVCCLVIGYRPPALIMNFAKYLTNCVTPLALIYCGYIIYDLGLKNLKLMRGIPTMLFLRFPVAALVCYACCRLAGMSGLMLQVFVIEASLPVVTQITVMAGAYGADEKYCATGTIISYFLMFVTLPVIVMWLSAVA